MKGTGFCFLLGVVTLFGCHAEVALGGPNAAEDGGGARLSPSSATCDTPDGTISVVDQGLHAYGIAVDETYVYTATSQGVWRVLRTGGMPTHLSGADEADSIAIDNSNVYWAGNYPIGSGPRPETGIGLFSAPLAGGRPRSSQLTRGRPRSSLTEQTFTVRAAVLGRHRPEAAPRQCWRKELRSTSQRPSQRTGELSTLPRLLPGRLPS